MDGLSKNLLRVSEYIAIPLFVITVGIPMISLSQEGVATTTPESIPVVDDTIATTTFSTATTTNELLPIPSEPEIATSTGEVLGESTATEIGGGTEENIGGDSVEESTQPIIIVDTPPSPRLSVREFKKRVVPDSRAFHSCEAEIFRIDISGKSSAKARIMLERDSDAPYKVEIGGVPHGINITFSKNSGYRYTQGAGDRSLELAIINQPGSQKGNFSVPIIYTQKGVKDSPVICQINIVNQ